MATALLEQLLEENPRRALELAAKELQLRSERAPFAAPGGLMRFVEAMWPVIEPDTPLVTGWALEAMALHLEAVAEGLITRLLINIPPGAMKSTMLNVFFPAWIWGPKGRPGARFLSISYSAALPERDNRKQLKLMESEIYQRLWGKTFRLVKAGEELLENNRTGFKQATGIGGTVTGRRGDYILCDDPNAVQDAESKPVREATARFFRETMSNRLNSVDSAIVVIQQRTHEGDVSGVILDDGLPYEHVCIPLLYEPGRMEPTSIGWNDPREDEGENFFPERYPPAAVEEARKQGAFAFTGQYQQRPEIRGGGLLPRDDWQRWDPLPDPVTGRIQNPDCDYIVASLDPAFTAKESNDPSALTVWGNFDADGLRSLILLNAWRKWLVLHGPDDPQQPGESYAEWVERTSEGWGLVEWAAHTCRQYRVDRLLIESKASGLSVAQEFIRLYPNGGTAVDLVDPGTLDKEARAKRVQHVLNNGQVWAPHRAWAEMVVDECAVFPRGKWDDLVDSSTAAWWYFRQNGFLARKSEEKRRELAAAKNYKSPAPLYPA